MVAVLNRALASFLSRVGVVSSTGDETLRGGGGHDARVFSGSHHYVFLVPRFVNALLHNSFYEVHFVPALACTLSEAEDGNSIGAFFIHNTVRVAVHQRGALLLQQQYTFDAALDVVYYLLKICAEFGFSQQATGLTVSGFIASDSALYQELHQYFLNINFSHPEPVSIGDSQLPKHLVGQR